MGTTTCPHWCDGDHGRDYGDAHRGVIGRVPGQVAEFGTLNMVVAVVAEPGEPARVELTWEGADPDDDGCYALGAIELDYVNLQPLSILLGRAALIVALQLADNHMEARA